MKKNSTCLSFVQFAIQLPESKPTMDNFLWDGQLNDTSSSWNASIQERPPAWPPKVYLPRRTVLAVLMVRGGGGWGVPLSSPRSGEEGYPIQSQVRWGDRGVPYLVPGLVGVPYPVPGLVGVPYPVPGLVVVGPLSSARSGGGGSTIQCQVWWWWVPYPVPGLVVAGLVVAGPLSSARSGGGGSPIQSQVQVGGGPLCSPRSGGGRSPIQSQVWWWQVPYPVPGLVVVGPLSSARSGGGGSPIQSQVWWGVPYPVPGPGGRGSPMQSQVQGGCLSSPRSEPTPCEQSNWKNYLPSHYRVWAVKIFKF